MYRARDTRLSMLGAAAKRFNFKPSCSRAESYANLRSGSPLNQASMPSTIWP